MMTNSTAVHQRNENGKVGVVGFTFKVTFRVNKSQVLKIKVRYKRLFDCSYDVVFTTGYGNIVIFCKEKIYLMKASDTTGTNTAKYLLLSFWKH